MSYELPALMGISAGYIASYFIGTRQKDKLVRKYSKTIHDALKDVGQVGFRPFGHAGVRIRCAMKSRDHALKSLEIAISLGGRENLLYYPLWFLWPERDTFTCWAFPEGPVNYVLDVLPAKNVKDAHKLETDEMLSSLDMRGLGLSEDYRAFTNDRDTAGRFLSDSEIRLCLSKLGPSVRRFRIDALNSRIYVSANVREKTLPTLVSLMLGAGKVFARTSV